MGGVLGATTHRRGARAWSAGCARPAPRAGCGAASADAGGGPRAQSGARAAAAGKSPRRVGHSRIGPDAGGPSGLSLPPAASRSAGRPGRSPRRCRRASRHSTRPGKRRRPSASTPTSASSGTSSPRAVPARAARSPSPLPGLSLQESEASFQAVVDPYARADFFLAIGEEGMSVEEGFITSGVAGGAPVEGRQDARNLRTPQRLPQPFPSLDGPAARDVQPAGRSHGRPGHGHQGRRCVGRRLVPAGSFFVEATAEVFRGDSGTVFKASRRQDLGAVGHLSLHGPDRTDEPRDRRVLRAGSQRRWQRVPDKALRAGPHSALASAAARDLPLLRGARRDDLEPARGGQPDTTSVRRLRVGRLPAEPPLVRRAPLRLVGPGTPGRYPGSRRLGGPHLPAQRVRARCAASTGGRRSATTGWPKPLLLQVLFTIGAHGAHPF